MNHSDIEHMAQGFPPSSIGKDHEEVVTFLATSLLAAQQKLDAVESKLAELHKQDPVLFRDSHGCFVSKGKGEQLIKSCEFVTPYYIRPAPAINLAELVPDENEIERIYSIYCTQTVGSKNALRHIRNELLRKIEEVK